MKRLHGIFFFSIRIFFHGHWRLTGEQGKGREHLLFHSTTSTRSRTFRHLFATLHVRWLSHIFNRTACIYRLYLFTWWFDSSFFLLQQFEMGNRWIRTRIDYHPCITSEHEKCNRALMQKSNQILIANLLISTASIK